MVYECERQRHIPAPAEAVWAWLVNPQQLFTLNLFHHSVEYQNAELRKGSRILIQHRFFGLYRQNRVARIRAYRPFFIAWGEFAAEGTDYFPHSQSFTIVPLNTAHCLIKNRLQGKFLIPGASYWLVPFFRLVGPKILEHENRQIVAAVDQKVRYS